MMTSSILDAINVVEPQYNKHIMTVLSKFEEIIPCKRKEN